MRDLLLANEKIDLFDIKLAELLVPDFDANPVVFYTVLLLSRAVRSQHSCLPLDKINLQDPFALALTEHGIKETPFSDYEELVNSIASHHAVGKDKPLRLVGGNLYLARFDDYEAAFVSAVDMRNKEQPQLDLSHLKELLNQYFGQSQTPDWQKVACAIACLKRFCIISGGPGTGKTTTVTKLLAVLQSLYNSVPLKIKLVAPTGKAAARLSESIANAKGHLALDAQLAKQIPDSAQTLHRLLGVIHLSNKFRHHQHNKLDVDLIVLDEASMVDLAMLAKLFSALPDHARVILLGDKDQLSSVDTGNVMADLCKPLLLGKEHAYQKDFAAQLAKLTGVAITTSPKNTYALTDNLAFLQVSHRFKGDSGIGKLAQAVNNNDVTSLNTISQNQYPDLTFTPLETDFRDFIIRAANNYHGYLTEIANRNDVIAIHKAFSSFQVLSATKVGPFGTEQLNLQIEKQLANEGKIIRSGAFYVGMPIMISENNYQLNLFNGDIGIIIRDETGRLMASFIDDNGQARLISTTRLPDFNMVYAMTIHKSQGSEFKHVAMVLPANSAVTNRQLVYTGITRAREQFELVSTSSSLTQAMGRGVSRYSGLFNRFEINT